MYATRDPERYDLSVQAKESGLLIGQLATYTKSFAYIQSHCPKLSVRPTRNRVRRNGALG